MRDVQEEGGALRVWRLPHLLGLQEHDDAEWQPARRRRSPGTGLLLTRDAPL